MSNNMEHKEIGRRIELRRKDLNLTLADVASAVGVAASTIQRYEKGQFEKIKMPVIEAIAAALHINPEWLVGLTDDPTTYDDPDLIASISLQYLEACNGDVKKAYKMMQAVDEDHLAEFLHKEKTPALTEKDERDVAKDVKKIMGDLENSGDLMFDGVPMSEEAKAAMAAAMRIGLEEAKRRNKATYTPKKYRKG